MSTVLVSRGVQYSAQAASDHGNLRCHVTRRRLADDGRAEFSIVVCNDTHADAHALAFFPDTPDGRHRTIAQTLIGPSSDFSTTVVLELSPAGSLPDLHVALTSGDIHFTLVVPSSRAGLALPDTPALQGPIVVPSFASGALPRFASAVGRDTLAPPLPAPLLRTGRSRRSPAATPILLFFVALMSIVAFIVFHPQIELAVPPTAAAGTTVGVPYRATGLGAAQYMLLGPDGQIVTREPLALGTGTLALTLPRTPVAVTYLLRLRSANIFGSADAEGYVRVPAPPRAHPATRRRSTPRSVEPPLIRSLALDRATLAGGDTLSVYYDVLAASGTIALIDPASQITYGKSGLAASGHTTFNAPRVDAAHLFTVVVTAQRGTASTQSRIGVTVTPPDAPSPPLGDASGAAAAGGPSSVIVAPPTVRSRQPFRVAVRNAAAGLQLVLLDGAGGEIARHDAPAGPDGVVFTAPAVRLPTRLLIEGIYASGVGSETVVQAITVLP